MLDATPLLRLYARWRLGRLAAQDPVRAQTRELRRLVSAAQATRFGRDHGFAGIRTVAGFQAQVPLRRYENLWAEYWRDDYPRLTDVTWPGTIPYFAVTSGTTTGVTKYMPCSHEMVRANKRAGGDLLVHHVNNRPRSRILAGRNFMLGGSTDLADEAPGILRGDLSGILVNEMPWWARARYFPPRELALISDWEEKVRRLAPASLEEDIRSISGTPSWLLIFFEAAAEAAGRPGARLAELYPRLEMLVHGGVNFAPYRPRFEALLEGSRAELREVYPATEGFIALADRGPEDGLRLLLDNGLFFEFVPVDELDSPRPARHWIETAECGVNYAIVVSNCAGQWASLIGDTVRFVSLRPPRIVVTGRTSYTLSAFGEHLIGEELDAAVSAAAEAADAQVTDYSAGALYPEREDARGGHLFIVEFARPVREEARLETFARALDERLCALNEDYEMHRSRGFGLAPPRVHAAPPGMFAAWMKARGQLGGQHKVPRVVTDPELFENLRAFARRFEREAR